MHSSKGTLARKRPSGECAKICYAQFPPRVLTWVASTNKDLLGSSPCRYSRMEVKRLAYYEIGKGLQSLPCLSKDTDMLASYYKHGKISLRLLLLDFVSRKIPALIGLPVGSPFDLPCGALFGMQFGRHFVSLRTHTASSAK
eukprot:scaffold8790_cov187-Amphora_coffeaeformis.AAC.7